MAEDTAYTVERYTAEIDAKAYIEDFRRADFLRDHKRFQEDITKAVEALENML